MLEGAGFVNTDVHSDGALNPDQVHVRTLRVRLAQRLVRWLSRYHERIARMALGDTLVASAERPNS